MRQVERAIWFIEAYFRDRIGVTEIAEAAGVSRFHLSRLFAETTGLSLMRYLRNRRLSEAARVLAAGEADVLTVALDHGYDSHEGFTRAFTALFDVTPEKLRQRGCLAHLTLEEPLKMTEAATVALSAPKIVSKGALRLIGIKDYVRFETMSSVPQQWQRFAARIHEVEGRAGPETYGVSLDVEGREDGFDYIAAVPVSADAPVPEGMSAVDVPASRHAVFWHGDHISTIGATCSAIFADWAPTGSPPPLYGQVQMVEMYDQRFDAVTGRGGVEIWLPVEG